MSEKEYFPRFLIDPPTFFSPLKDLIEFREEAKTMLSEYPGNKQWLEALSAVNKDIAERKRSPLPGDKSDE